ncbi:ABC transport system, Transmembrane and ATP-binding site (ABC-IM) [Vibrio crassostreae]|uniref:ABC transport system, Transmembrane and ATP-binding site (ABC-IM) n=1 Tax=Vibrio crassostreae TaxID=246167 RepID=A0A822MZE2_9VIBR|nr:ABC transporter ATP-binding protein [Vibrio crassostreae]MDH5950939.1 ABC transporter ATP-binding protein/permease [Vibrio crassostreae]CAK1706238.1 ABC transport system, Transmembrane and ATP-binding site (ABC-IM) [Vibrio crassostreae]CAK1707029.1 ABC transport system, Transmembrane and ATP-binding site (ABC-IM) [Vibrio crassostreae]CAK1723544.1 ABC transport system, Transmembrane and ATP-binding site (ABC-IM) [Vibrio crassostreae]CAK1723769.1 ABC transport system, Transmembrane and ATP-bi
MNKRQFIAHYLRMNRTSYLLAIVFIFLVNWLQVEIPRYIQLAIDLIDDASSTGHQQLQTYVWIVVGMSVAMVVVRILSRIYALNPGRITEAALKSTLLQKLNRLPSSFHERFASGRLISIINNDLSGIRLMFGVGFLQFFNALLALSLTPLYMWRISPELTLYSIIPISIAFVIFRVGFKRMKTLHLEHMKRLQNLSAQLMSYLSGIDLIKSQQMSPWVKAETEKLNQLLLECRLKITRIQVFFMPVLDYANDLMKIIILGLGGFMLMRQELTLGEITAFLTYSVLLAMPLMQLGRIATIYQRGMVGIQSAQTILNAKVPELDEEKLSELDVESLKGETFSIRNLSFSYAGEERLILDDISFDIPAGKKVGVLGGIGAGKTTLVNCLNHHLDVPKGSVFLGEKDVTGFSRSDLRRYVKTVTQDPYLFSATVEDNIRFGSLDTDLAKNQVDEVLELSQLASDVTRFEHGDQTLVGEKGIMLSGGQKQRLSIARALLQTTDLIIMDNVLSAVDYETERKILEGLFQRLENQSVLVVSHRVNALEYMDEIIVLNEGKVIAKGDHATLLKTCPYYFETWQLQQNETEATAC